MNNKEKKSVQAELAKKNIEFFYNLLETRFNSEFDKNYIEEIKNLSEGFIIRLSSEQKIKFCKKCNTYWDITTREIRFNSITKNREYICKNCGFTRKFKYKQ